MSVLSCRRANCKNIMCDRYSHRFGYICDDCFAELEELGGGVDIDRFMRTEKRLPKTQRLDKIFIKNNGAG